jgi:hypothetical protein
MFALSLVLITLLGPGGATAIAVHRAPEGYQDEIGFHFTERPLPGCGGASRLLPLILGTISSVPDLLLSIAANC